MSSEPSSLISAWQRGMGAGSRFWQSIGGSGKNFAQIGKRPKGQHAIILPAAPTCGAIKSSRFLAQQVARRIVPTALNRPLIEGENNMERQISLHSIGQQNLGKEME